MRPTNNNLATSKSPEEIEFRRLFESNYKGLVQFAFTYLYSRAASEDLVQTVFASVWEKRDKLEFGAKIKSYLFMAVKSRCLNELEKLKVKGRIETDWLEKLLLDEMDAPLNEDVEHMLRQNIDLLPPQVRKIIDMKYFEGRKIDEICNELRISKNTVKTQIKRGRSKLRNSLQHILSKTRPDIYALWLLIFPY